MARIAPVVLNWKGLSTTVDLVAGVTPAPKLEYLTALNTRIQGACCGPYAHTGLACFLELAGNKVLTQQMVNVATKALRPLVSRSSTRDGDAPDTTSIFAASSGASSPDEIVLPSPFAAGSDGFPPDSGGVDVVGGAATFNATPASAMDRLLESPTATSLMAPVRERIEPRRGLGITIEPILVADLSTL